ncbi:glycosyl hydrolase family 8 [Polyangium sp. rjm3]|uniref:cellulase n=2 Tax=Polyangium mundeleinium TaxID=2995306 RepID=A0ABT5EFX3_9BACT|nr:glycosyl hydrolase family 8 [Polyangium mundeleinium]
MGGQRPRGCPNATVRNLREERPRAARGDFVDHPRDRSERTPFRGAAGDRLESSAISGVIDVAQELLWPRANDASPERAGRSSRSPHEDESRLLPPRNVQPSRGDPGDRLRRYGCTRARRGRVGGREPAHGAEPSRCGQRDQQRLQHVEDEVRDGLGGGRLPARAAARNSNDTVSEGIAYGMLLSAYLGDKPTFDGLWGYAKSHFDGNGLMHWQINASNSVIGWNAATDSDEDMALALIVAEKAWGASYGADATTLLGRILQHEVESGTNVLKPGDAWGGSSVTNPSYFAPGYYRAFKAYTGDARWESVAASCYQIIANLNTKTGAGTTGLLPDWTTAAGTQASGMGFDYRYDAARVPWRLAVDAVWYGTPQAIAQLDKLNTFWKGVGVGNIKDGYTVSGGLLGQWHNATFVGMAASGAAVSSDAAFKTAMWNETKNFQSENYYNDSLRVLALLFMGDRMPNPVGGSTPPPSQNAAPSVSVTAPSNGGTFTTPASITIQASASDSDGTVSKVEFFAGAVKLGEDTTAPYAYTWSNVAAGSYAITAKATDNAGASTTSSVVAVTVNDPSQPPPVGGGSLSVQYRAGDTNASDNQIRPHLNIVNTGASSVPLSELKIRYWYTSDGANGQQSACDYAVVGART